MKPLWKEWHTWLGCPFTWFNEEVGVHVIQTAGQFMITIIRIKNKVSRDSSLIGTHTAAMFKDFCKVLGNLFKDGQVATCVHSLRLDIGKCGWCRPFLFRSFFFFFLERFAHIPRKICRERSVIPLPPIDISKCLLLKAHWLRRLMTYVLHVHVWEITHLVAWWRGWSWWRQDSVEWGG